MQNTDNDIDYMHPDGKPAPAEESIAKFDGRELEAAAKREKCALIDADGHHLCSEECHRRHEKQK